MPNLNGLLSGHPHSMALTALAVCMVLAAGGLAMRRGGIGIAIAATLLSGLLLSYHAFTADAVMSIPAGLFLLRDKASLVHRALGAILLSPLPYLGAVVGNAPFPPAAVLLLSLMAMAAISASSRWRIWRRLPASRVRAGAVSVAER
jgi:hypothetical protein